MVLTLPVQPHSPAIPWGDGVSPWLFLKQLQWEATEFNIIHSFNICVALASPNTASNRFFLHCSCCTEDMQVCNKKKLFQAQTSAIIRSNMQKLRIALVQKKNSTLHGPRAHRWDLSVVIAEWSPQRNWTLISGQNRRPLHSRILASLVRRLWNLHLECNNYYC